VERTPVNPIWKQALVFLALASGIPPSAVAAPEDPPIRRYIAEAVPMESGPGDDACLAMAVSLAFDADRIYVADAQDCAIKIFTKKGRFEAAVGRKGSGPGEFSFPSGVAVLGGRVFVADKFNYRVQVLEASGRYLRSFGVPFAPDKVFVLGADRILVTNNGTGRSGADKLLHLYNGKGDLLREDMPAHFSGDPVFDAFSNMFLVNPGPGGEFFVVYRSRERSVFHYGRDAALLGRIPMDGRYALKRLSLPAKGGLKEIEAFCWDSAYDCGRFYLLAPAFTGEGDLGPGDQVFVFNGAGRLEARIDLPTRVARLAVDGGRIYAIDRAGDLRIFRVAP
jgi:hypothetical protein